MVVIHFIQVFQPLRHCWLSPHVRRTTEVRRTFGSALASGQLLTSSRYLLDQRSYQEDAPVMSITVASQISWKRSPRKKDRTATANRPAAGYTSNR